MTAVSWDQVLRWRVERQFLGGERAPDAVAVARRLCGVHAQLAASAVSAIDLRTTKRVTGRDIDRQLHEERSLVKTWAARGTLHLLPAADLPTWVAAMSTRTRETTGSWLRYHGVTATQMVDILAALPDVLGDTPLTREELADALVAATGHDDLRGPLTQGFGAILKPAAFRGLLCSGPPRGRNVTFVAPRAWLSDWTEVDPEPAADALVLAHLGAYGPAGPEEFSRWFDLKPALARKAFARLGDKLAAVDVDGDPAMIAAEHLDSLAAAPRKSRPTVHLLPAFDPYVVGSLRQLDALGAGAHKALVSRPQGWISPAVVVDGRIVGVWEQDNGRRRVSSFADLPAAVRTRLDHDVTIVS
jgi:hypothetical protein